MDLTIKHELKQTEVGLIPKDWSAETIGKLASITTGGSDTKDRVDDGLYPFFVRSQTVERINQYSFDGEAILTSGDGVGVGKIFHYVNCKFDYHQRVYNIHNYRNDISGKYLFFQFSTNFYNRVMSMTAKSSVDSVRREMIADMKIPLPPTLKEQKAIANALSDVDELIISLEKVISKKKAIKQGALQQLLKPPHKGGKRLPGFDGIWVEKTLGEIADISGAGVDKKIVPGEKPIRLFNYMDVVKRDYVYKYELNHTVTAPYYKTINCNVVKGDIFLTPSSELRTDIGISAIAMEDMEGVVYSYHVYRLRYNITLNELFGLYLLKTKHFLNQAEKMCEGSGKRYVVSMGKFKNMNVFLPSSLEEQQAIANILYDLDSEIKQLETKKSKFQSIKQGMMQELLTGKTRLI